MTVNLSRRQRVAIYLINIVGTPVVAYALAKGWIGELELTLWAAEVTAAMTLAGLNVASGLPVTDLAEYERLYDERTRLIEATAEAARATSTGDA